MASGDVTSNAFWRLPSSIGSNLNLHVDSGRIDPSRECRSDARAIGILANCCAGKRGRIDDDGVIRNVQLGDLLYELQNRVNLIGRPS